jgi:hypothetical protein
MQPPLQGEGLEQEPAPSALPSFIGTLLIATIPPLVLVIYFDASWKVFGIGGGAWISAILIKILTNQAVARVVNPHQQILGFRDQRNRKPG